MVAHPSNEQTPVRIPQPAALPGQQVDVLNYRKRPAEWERGIVRYSKFTIAEGTAGRWSYEVRLDRRMKSRRNPEHGRPFDLTVGNDAIEVANV